jgi:hypothetical protein
VVYLASPVCTAILFEKVVRVVAWAWAPCVLPGGGGGDRGGEQPTGRPLTSPGVWGTCAGAPPHSQRWSLGPLRPPHCVVTPLQLNTPVRSGRSGAVLVSWAERCGQLGGAQPLSVERGAATVSWAGRPFVCSPRQPSPTHMTAVSLAEQP